MLRILREAAGKPIIASRNNPADNRSPTVTCRPQVRYAGNDLFRLHRGKESTGDLRIQKAGNACITTLKRAAIDARKKCGFNRSMQHKKKPAEETV